MQTDDIRWSNSSRILNENHTVHGDDICPSIFIYLMEKRLAYSLKESFIF